MSGVYVKMLVRIDAEQVICGFAEGWFRHMFNTENTNRSECSH